MRRPGVVDLGAVREQPAADHGFGEARTLLPRGSGGEVAQPGEALQLLREGAGRADLGEVEILEREGFAAGGEAAGQQGFAALAFAVDMIARHRDDLQRLLRLPQPGKKGAASKLADNGALGGRPIVGQDPPRSALMLSA